MLFVDLVNAIRSHIMKEGNVEDFMRDLIQMLSDVPEGEWSTAKDPSSKKSNTDATLRKAFNNGPTQKLARAILGRLTREHFIDALIYERPDEVLINLAEEIQPFVENKTADKYNVAEILFELLQESLEFIANPKNKQERQIHHAKRTSQTLKTKVGELLLEDAKNTCSYPGCGKSLLKHSNNNYCFDYEIVRIPSNNKTDYDSTIALCHDCFTSQIIAKLKKNENKLVNVKKVQVNNRKLRETSDELDIQNGIQKVVESLGSVKSKELEQLNFNAVSVASKIDKSEHFMLFDEVNNYVIRYYLSIENQMQIAVDQKLFNDDLLRAQIKAIYKNLADKRYSPEEIYNALTEKLVRITKQEYRYCAIVISYFIQSCEVFNAITK